MKHLFKKILKLTAFARVKPLLFSRTGLSNLLNKVQFTCEVVPCLILGLFRRFFTDVHQFWPSVTRCQCVGHGFTALQGCKSTPQKSRPIESGHGRHVVQVANVCSYKLGQN